MASDSTFSSFDHIGASHDSDTVRPCPFRVPTIIFGSQGGDFTASFDIILALSYHQPELATFLSLALDAVREQLQSVAHGETNAIVVNQLGSKRVSGFEAELLALLPPFEPFSDLKTLVNFHRRTGLRDPVINGVLLCLFHTASVVAVYCAAHQVDSGENAAPAHLASLREAWQTISQPCAHLLGFCTGTFSAFAMSQLVDRRMATSAFNLWTYVREAVKCVCTSFWIGLRSAQARQRLASADGPARSLGHWSIVVVLKEADRIEEFFNCLLHFDELERRRPLSRHIPIAVTARAMGQISLGGPPQILDRFKAYLAEKMGAACRVSPLEIFSPYHSTNLRSEAELVMMDLERQGLVDDSLLPLSKKFLWDTGNAEILSETTLRAAFRRCVDSNLCFTADWDRMIDNLILLAGESPDAATQNYGAIVSFGPGTALATDLKKRISSSHGYSHSLEATKLIDLPSLLRDWSATTAKSEPNPPRLLQPDVHGEDVVIVSMACRFPGNVRTPEQLWTCFETGRSTVTEIPKHLFDIDAYHGDGLNQTLARHMHALPESVTKSMDARLFSMSPKEIEQLDPQHRLVMLCSYEALERAGFSSEANSPSSFDGKRIAVCMGASWDDYRENASWNIGSYFITGNIRAFIPGHVSFSLKWEGPSVSVDSLECSAVSAIQWSRRALLSGQCDVALAGAVNVLTQPQMFIAMDKEGILSRSGTNATFSKRLDGKTRGDGCGVLLLKRHSTAIRDGDKILATLPAARTTYHGVALDRHDSSTRQAGFLERVLSEANTRPSDLVHIEASGFHTQQGEAAEMESFARLLGHSKVGSAATPDGGLSVASSRPNVGAGEAVSAMASVMKAVLMFENGSVPRQISIPEASELQPDIATTLASSALFVPTQAKLLATSSSVEGRRTILVNSLASTGCHGVVLVSAPTSDEAVPSGRHPASEDRPFHENQAWLFALSAKTKESGEMIRKSLIDYLQREVCLADLSYTLLCRRTQHPFRLSVVAAEKDELIQLLRSAEFTEAKASTDLPRFGLLFRRPRQASKQSMERLFKATLGLRGHYNELIAALGQQGSPEADRQLDLMQVCFASFLEDCGVLPSLVAGNMIPMLLSGKWLNKQSALTALSESSFIEGETPLRHIVQMGSVDFLTPEGELVQCSTPLPWSDEMYNKLAAERSEEVETKGPNRLPSAYRWILISDSVEIMNDITKQADVHRLSAGGEPSLERCLLGSLGRLYQEGYVIRWIEYFRPYLSHLQFLETLPTYAFQFQQYWMDYHDRNLLPQHAPTAEEQPIVASGEAPDTKAEDPLVQPLLTAQSRVEDGSQMYTSDLTGEAQVALLKRTAPAALSVELMVEAMMEAIGSSNRKAELDTDNLLCLSSLQLNDAGRKLLLVPSTTLTVKPSIQCEDRREYVVDLQCDGDSPVIGKCTSTLLAGRLNRRWSRLQAVFEEKIRSLKDSGELLDARLVYKSIHGDLSTSTRSIGSAHFKSQTREVLFCNRLLHGDTPLLREGHCALALLLSTIEECARWYTSVLATDAEAEHGITAIEELTIDSGWLESLGKQTCSAREYALFISPVQNAIHATTTKDQVLIDMLLLNDKSQIVGALDWVRLAKVEIGSKKPSPKPAKVAAATTANVSKAALPSARGTHPDNVGQPRGAPNPTGDKHTSPARTVHAKIIKELASELGIAVEEMKPSVKFADLGLDSLMSLVCISTLESLDLGFEIPQSLFMECDSPEELLAWVQGQVGEQGTDGSAEPVLDQADATMNRAAMGALKPVAPSAALGSVDVRQTCQAAQLNQGSSVVDGTMKTITSTIETELGVAEGSIDEEANLADLGLDSLMSLLVLGNLSGTLTIELPSSLFMDCTSLGEIRNFLAAELGDTIDTVQAGAANVENRSDQVNASLPARGFTIAPPKKPVLVRNGTNPGCDTPLFLLPDGSGMSTVYQFFPAIERPVYSVNSPFLASASEWNGGMAQIAQYYLASIKLVQPTGPWVMGGWSFGGLVAFEIARTLALSNSTPNDRVAGLFLLDSPCPALYPPLPMSIVDWIFNAPEVKHIAPPALSTKLVEHFKATVNSLVDWRPSSMAQSDAVKIPQVWYVVADHALPGRIEDIKQLNETVKWLFTSNRAATNGTDGWETYIPSHCINVVSVVEANHFTLVREHAFSKVASILQEACRSVLQS